MTIKHTPSLAHSLAYDFEAMGGIGTPWRRWARLTAEDRKILVQRLGRLPWKAANAYMMTINT